MIKCSYLALQNISAVPDTLVFQIRIKHAHSFKQIAVFTCLKTPEKTLRMLQINVLNAT